MKINNFNQTIQHWLDELEKYNFRQLSRKANPKTWSLGQLYLHLVDSTNYFFEQTAICLSTNDNNDKEMYESAKKMFQNGEFPDITIEGPPSNADTPNPTSKEEITNSLFKLKRQIEIFEIQLVNNICSGKTKHPGQNYFTAIEWYNYAEMHFRHHLRQKKRIDNFLELDNEIALREKTTNR